MSRHPFETFVERSRRWVIQNWRSPQGAPDGDQVARAQLAAMKRYATAGMSETELAELTITIESVGKSPLVRDIRLRGDGSATDAMVWLTALNEVFLARAGADMVLVS